jgi:catechol 2,3-dioxygenase-like lactoylglutathione lyase family enzyme
MAKLAVGRLSSSTVAELNHVGITVTDLDASLEFYRDVVGFEVGLRTRAGGEWFDTLTRNEGADIEIAMLRLADFTLQLVQYHASGGATLPLAHHKVGSPHLCIQVDDVDVRHEKIVASGLYEPTAIVDVLGTGIRSFYVHDPDGVPVELLQGWS